MGRDECVDDSQGAGGWANGEGVASLRVCSAPAVGVGLGLAIAGNWGIRLNVSDSRKGGDASQPHRRVTLKHNYLEISLLADLALDLGDGDRASLHLLAGPAVARIVSCHVNSGDCRSGRFKDHDYGVVGGAEVEFGLFDGLGATLGALYTYGLLDLNALPDWDTVEKNRNLTLRAGLKASIGHR